MISFVYVIGCTDNPVKVGYADRVETRLSTLQIGNPNELKILGKVVVPWDKAARVEYLAHEMLAEHHRRGEWFNVSAAEALTVIERARAQVEAANDNVRYRATQLEVILDTYTTHRWARHALNHYHVKRNTLGETPYVEQMHSVIREQAGAGALIAFQTFQRRDATMFNLKRRDPAAFRKACEATVDAINALSIWYANAQRRGHLDKISGNAA